MSYTQEIKDKIAELASQVSDDCTAVGYGFKESNGKLTKEKSIIFTFKKKKPLEELSEDEIIPKEIQIGDKILRTDVKEGTHKLVAYEACPADFYYWSSNSTLNPNGASTPIQRNEVRPLKGGLQIRNQSLGFLGTMGFIAVDKDTNSLVGVTNAHVMTECFFRANESGRGDFNVYNNNMGQPATSASQRVGVTKRYVPIKGYSSNVNYVDGAIFTLDESEIDLNESYKYYGFSFESAPPFATTEEIDDLINNDYDLFSVGRTTGAKGEGTTKLKFLSYDTVYVYNDITEATARLTRYDECISYIASASTTTDGNGCFYPINSGDSGSALLANINGTIKIIGLSFAGSTTGSADGYMTIARACRIDRVAEELNIEAFTGQTVNFSDKSNPQVHYEIGSSSQETVTINGNKFYQVGTIT
jgi:hypothetical protein